MKSVSSMAKLGDGEGGGERCEHVSGVCEHVSDGPCSILLYPRSMRNLSVSGPALEEPALRTCM